MKTLKRKARSDKFTPRTMYDAECNFERNAEKSADSLQCCTLMKFKRFHDT